MINNVVLVGRLTRDPDLRYTGNGTAVATFTLAVERNFSGANGERATDFLSCVVWRKQAETLANYTRKGTLLGVQGRLQSRSYDNQQGQKVYVTEVVVDEFQFLESKAQTEQRQSQGGGGYSNNAGGNNSGFGGSPAPQQNSFNNQNQSTSNQMPSFDRDTSDPFGSDASSIDISDDDLPF